MIKLDVSQWSVEQRILAVLAYFDIFDLALKAEEIADLVIGQKISEKELKDFLSKDGRLIFENGYFALKSRGKLIQLRQKKIVQEAKLKAKIVNSLWLFRCVPFVRGVAICNYLNLGVVDEGSDIDLLLLTAPNRIFIARVWLTLLMQVFGLRRHGKKVAERFCLSFYVNEEALNFSEITVKPYDIYLIYWLKALWPIYGEIKLWDKLEKENQWVKKYLNWSIKKADLLVGKNWFGAFGEWKLGGKMGDFVEEQLKKYFQKRHRNKLRNLPPNASVIVNENMLKYHNNDRRAYFREEWEKRLKMLGFAS